MECLFWTSLLLVIYCYIGYPILLAVTASFLHKPVVKQDIEPTVAIILCAWNEEDVIGGKIANLLKLDYPKDKLAFLIGSDGSDDKTDKIVLSFKEPNIKLLRQPTRMGKMALLRRLLDEATAEIIVFTDARQHMQENSIRALVANFADPAVGCASGELVFRPKEGATAKGINFYWNYEKFLRKSEARIHSMLGATGAIYAARKKLISNLPDNIILDDMYIPFMIIQQGFRAVFDESAKAFDEVANSPREEYKRKTRTIYGNYQIFKRFAGLFNPFKSPVALQLFSHKLLRVMAPFLLILLLIINVFLIKKTFYGIIFLLQIIFYSLAFIGFLARYDNYGTFKTISKICYIPYVFCLLNFSALMGFLNMFLSKQSITWDKARG